MRSPVAIVRVSDHRQAHRRDGTIDTLGVNAVAIMNEESMRLVAPDHHSELLRRPIGGGMFGHILVACTA